jgi:hypothetical protein
MCMVTPCLPTQTPTDTRADSRGICMRPYVCLTGGLEIDLMLCGARMPGEDRSVRRTLSANLSPGGWRKSRHTQYRRQNATIQLRSLAKWCNYDEINSSKHNVWCTRPFTVSFCILTRHTAGGTATIQNPFLPSHTFVTLQYVRTRLFGSSLETSIFKNS